jgi:hypothetical protein
MLPQVPPAQLNDWLNQHSSGSDALPLVLDVREPDEQRLRDRGQYQRRHRCLVARARPRRAALLSGKTQKKPGTRQASRPRCFVTTVF